MTRAEAMEAKVKKRPILFSGEMVRALLAGRKTQTRRVVKDVPPETVNLRLEDGWLRTYIGDVMDLPDSDPDAWTMLYTDWESGYSCPYGVPGDRLWVKETIRHIGDGGSEYMADGEWTKGDTWPWKREVLSSMHLPRGLSRILLEITDVRVQRVQEISEEDALAEGIDAADWVREWSDLWESIHGAGSWARNDWVWAITFQRVQP